MRIDTRTNAQLTTFVVKQRQEQYRGLKACLPQK
jgi:hypothetical protein